MTQTFIKDPDAVLDYSINWSAWLSTDTIDTSVWTADTGITVDSYSNTTTVATVWMSGGTAGNQYAVTNSITTTAGREEDRTIYITVMER